MHRPSGPLLLRARLRSALGGLAVALGIIVIACAPAARADVLERPRPRIVNGVLTGAFASTGALLRGASPDTAGTWCSGTLIGCETFLTAGHCVENRTPAELWVYLPNAGILPVAAIEQHPDYDFPAADIAVVKLGTPVLGVPPSRIETTAAPPFGSTGTIVGYGRSGGGNFDYGLKRAGDVVTAECTDIPSPGSDLTSVCWNFETPLGPAGDDANTCNADSGGPLLVDSGAGVRVAGVTSGGSSLDCSADDHSYDANVYTYRSFVQAEGGADLANTSCGNLSQVGSGGTTVEELTGTLSSGVLQGTHSFSVGASTTLLRVAMNAIDDGVSDFDLYVRAGTAPTITVYDCGRFGPNQYGVCEFAAPASGPWHVLVSRYKGAGAYQLTVTQFTNTCSAPGTDGNPCDDENPCTTDDVCQASVCTGAPVVNGTPCTDGNACTGPDTCQAGSCASTPVTNGTPCDDGDPCSRPDTCQAGSCNGTSPAIGCKVATPQGALLTIDNKTPDARDRFGWTLRKGPLTSLGELGNPTATTPYTLCLYDSVSGVPQRRFAQAIPPGGRWKAFSRGFRYRDATVLAAGGLQSIVLTAGAAGKSGVLLRGRGDPLPLPPMPLTRQPNAIIQLLNDTTCWSSTFSTVADNSTLRFRAKSD